MSKQDLIKVVQRSINDAAFRRQLTTDTANALRGYSLTPDEVGALRSRDAGKLTAFGVDTRMSKVFTIDQGALGSATITSGGSALGNATSISEPRDTDPVWTGDGAAHGAIQTPDAGERNAMLTGESSARGAVQSPDAAERNASIIGDPQLSATSGVQSPDAADRNLAYAASEGAASGGVQSPDAMDRNLASAAGFEPRDDAPVWIGDTANSGTVAPVEGSPEETAFNLANTATGSEPHDSDPTWIGDTDTPSGSEGSIHQE